jgi:hypothetical protein
MKQPFSSEEIQRHQQALLNIQAADVAHAAQILNTLQAKRKTVAVEVHNLQAYLECEPLLLQQPVDSDIFLHLNFPVTFSRWNLVELAGTYPVDQVLARLWANKRRLYVVRAKGTTSLTGGSFNPIDPASL